MHDCTDCAYEEFFLASQTVGDPALLVKHPANTGIEQCDPKNILSQDCWRQFNDPVYGAVGPGPDGIFEDDPSTPDIDESADNTMVDSDNDGVPEVGANPPIPGNEALYQEDPSTTRARSSSIFSTCTTSSGCSTRTTTMRTTWTPRKSCRARATLMSS
jgi:hypothetical protein